MQKAKTSDRIGYFNFARGIGILMVIFGHSVSLLYPMTFTDRLFGNWGGNLGGAAMAMFFMISGFGFFSRKNGKCIRTQAELLLKPYAITVLLILAAKLALALLKHRSFWNYGGDLVFSYLFAVTRSTDGGYQGTILGLPLNNVAMMWFFWALFGGWCIYNAIVRLKNEKLTWILTGLCVCLGQLMCWYTQIWFFCIPQMLLATGYIALGDYIHKKELIDRPLKIWQYILLFIPVFITLAFGGVDMFTAVWRLYLIDYIGIACLGYLLLRMFARLADRNPKNIVYKTISAIGANTLLILCIHAFDEKVIPWHNWDYLFEGRELLGAAVYAAVRCVFIFAAFKVITLIQEKIIRKYFKKKKKKKIKLTIDKADT